MWMHRLQLRLRLVVAQVMIERETSFVLAYLLHGSRIAACWLACAEMRWW